MNTSLAPLGWHMRIILFVTASLTIIYVILLVIPSYLSGIYRYSDAEILASPHNGIVFPSWMHIYRGELGLFAFCVAFFVPFIIIPVLLASGALNWLALTARERRIWMLITLAVLCIYGTTMHAVSALITYIAD